MVSKKVCFVPCFVEEQKVRVEFQRKAWCDAVFNCDYATDIIREKKLCPVLYWSFAMRFFHPHEKYPIHIISFNSHSITGWLSLFQTFQFFFGKMRVRSIIVFSVGWWFLKKKIFPLFSLYFSKKNLFQKITQNLPKTPNKGIELSKYFWGFPDFQSLEFYFFAWVRVGKEKFSWSLVQTRD